MQPKVTCIDTNKNSNQVGYYLALIQTICDAINKLCDKQNTQQLDLSKFEKVIGEFKNLYKKGQSTNQTTDETGKELLENYRDFYGMSMNDPSIREELRHFEKIRDVVKTLVNDGLLLERHLVEKNIDIYFPACYASGPIRYWLDGYEVDHGKGKKFVKGEVRIFLELLDGLIAQYKTMTRN